jgi:hypothetical protein
LAEVALLKKHLPKTLVLAGVDAEEHSESDKAELEREKLKLKAVEGRSVTDE